MWSWLWLSDSVFIFSIACFLNSSLLKADDTLDESATKSAASNGLGDEISWSTLDSGLELASQRDTPVMLIIHKSWCGACKALKPKFAESEEIRALSQKFVMVNWLDDDEKYGYAPDGGYIPRILFLDSMGKVKEDIYNEQGNPKYKYFYSDANQVVASMKRALSEAKVKSGTDEL